MKELMSFGKPQVMENWGRLPLKLEGLTPAVNQLQGGSWKQTRAGQIFKLLTGLSHLIKSFQLH